MLEKKRNSFSRGGSLRGPDIPVRARDGETGGAHFDLRTRGERPYSEPPEGALDHVKGKGRRTASLPRKRGGKEWGAGGVEIWSSPSGKDRCGIQRLGLTAVARRDRA